MVWLWVLLAVALLLVLLCRTRVGVRGALDREGTLRLDVKIGPVGIHILPARTEKKAKPKKEKKSRKKEKEKPAGEKREKPRLSFTLEDGKDALHSLLPPLRRALGRTRRGIRIKPLRLSLTLGGREDPASAAETWGRIQAAVWTGMPVLERLIDIPDPSIHTGVDFESESSSVEGEAGADFRIGTLLAVGFGLAIPALRWFLRYRKRAKSRPPKPEKKKREKSPEKMPEADSRPRESA